MSVELKSHEELLALTAEQVAHWRELECARAGLPFLPELPPPPEAVKPQPDVQMYQIGGALVRTLEEAQRIADALNSCTRYSDEYLPGREYTHKGFKPDEDMESPTSAGRFSAPAWEAVRRQVAEAREKKEAWDIAKKEFDEVSERRREIEEAVSGQIHAARDRRHKRETLGRHFDRFLRLANDDETIAWNFLAEAYPNLVKDFPEARDELVPPLEVTA